MGNPLELRKCYFLFRFSVCRLGAAGSHWERLTPCPRPHFGTPDSTSKLYLYSLVIFHIMLYYPSVVLAWFQFGALYVTLVLGTVALQYPLAPKYALAYEFYYVFLSQNASERKSCIGTCLYTNGFSQCFTCLFCNSLSPELKTIFSKEIRPPAAPGKVCLGSSSPRKRQKIPYNACLTKK